MAAATVRKSGTQCCNKLANYFFSRLTDTESASASHAARVTGMSRFPRTAMGQCRRCERCEHVRRRLRTRARGESKSSLRGHCGFKRVSRCRRAHLTALRAADAAGSLSGCYDLFGACMEDSELRRIIICAFVTFSSHHHKIDQKCPSVLLGSI